MSARENLQILRARANPDARNDLLAQLLATARPQIASIVLRGMGADNGMIRGEASQAFLAAASQAIDSARLDDDGRGKNDPMAWCMWRGLNAVRDEVRKHRGRPDRPSIRQRQEQNLVYASDLEAGEERVDSVNHNIRSFDEALARAGHYRAETAEDEAMVDVLIEQLLGRLTAPLERSIAELLIFGRSGHIELTCTCPRGSASHRISSDIAHAVGYSEQSVHRIVKKIRDTTTDVFGLGATA